MQLKDDTLIDEEQLQKISENKLNAISRMVAGLAHEINNPLTILLGKVYRLKKICNDSQIFDPKEAIQLSTEIENVCFKISNTISSLQLFSKDGTKDPFEFVPLSRVLNETLSHCTEELQAQGIELILTGQSESVLKNEIYCQPLRISQVLLTLVHNAQDALAQTQKPKIEIQVQISNEQVGIQVIDNGPGVPEEIKDQIFEPFMTTKIFGKGSGLNLSIAKKIVQEHSGKLDFQSSSSGSAFTILMPKVS